MEIKIENIEKVVNDDGLRKLLVLILAEISDQIAESSDMFCMDDFIVFSIVRLAEILFNTKYEKIEKQTLEKLKEAMWTIGELKVKCSNFSCTLFPTINFFTKGWAPQGLCAVCLNKNLNSKWPSIIAYLYKEHLNNEVSKNKI